MSPDLSREYLAKKLIYIFSLSVKNQDCFELSNYKAQKRYRYFSFNGKPMSAHRIMFYCYYGFDPDKFTVCHKCDNPSCINPEHLFLGNTRSNILDCVKKGRHRNQNTGKVFCKNGHDLTVKENVKIEKHGLRRCRPCRREYHKKWRKKKHEQRNH